MNQLKSANLVAGIVLFTLIALPIVYVLSMPIVVENTDDTHDFIYVLSVYAPVHSTLRSNPKLLTAYECWSGLFGVSPDDIVTYNWKHRFAQQILTKEHDSEWPDPPEFGYCEYGGGEIETSDIESSTIEELNQAKEN